MRIRWSETTSFVVIAIGGMVGGLSLWVGVIAGVSFLLTIEGATATRMPPSSPSIESTAPVLAASKEEGITGRSVQVGAAAIGSSAREKHQLTRFEPKLKHRPAR
jgi:uncharacterized membrane protein YagU involved in acid resistance